VLRPILVGRDAQLHDLYILIGTLGGLAAFGPVGLVFGPVLGGAFPIGLEDDERTVRGTS
jgi:predicted PurR-regulated permease PerM